MLLDLRIAKMNTGTQWTWREYLTVAVLCYIALC